MYKFIKDDSVSIGNITDILADFEKKYGIIIPDALKDYYIGNNDSKIQLCHFTVDGYKCEVSKIIPIVSSGLSVEKIVENNRVDGFINENLYPLAINRGGDTYYWDSRTENVYLLLSDDIENPFKICNSINEFWDILNDCHKVD